MTVLLDTGLIYAFLNREDANHREAKDLVHRIGRRAFGAPFVTDHVVDELFTLVRARTRSPQLEAAARRFLPLPDPQVHGLVPLSLGGAALRKAWEVFDRYRDQRISFTDATLIVTLKELHMDMLATFDDRLRKLVPCAT
ncbi:MAG TPA: PIN domain-containing protein [Candidatus Thermoplasmatota archaeon]